MVERAFSVPLETFDNVVGDIKENGRLSDQTEAAVGAVEKFSPYVNENGQVGMVLVAGQQEPFFVVSGEQGDIDGVVLAEDAQGNKYELAAKDVQSWQYASLQDLAKGEMARVAQMQ